MLGVSIFIIFIIFGLLALFLVPIVLSRLNNITVRGILVFGFVSGVVSASNHAEDRLIDKLYHIQSQTDWHIVVNNTWESFPSALLGFSIGYMIFLLICFYISKLFKKTT